MSKKSQWKLTENGVLSLYEKHFKKEVKVQIIFRTDFDDIAFVRLSDGCHRSPVTLVSQRTLMDKIMVGAIICIKERTFQTFEEYKDVGDPQYPMDDNGMHHLHIKKYTLVAGHREVKQLLGSVRNEVSYRDDMAMVLSVLTKWIPRDLQLEWEHSAEARKLSQQQAERIREKGNYFFKQNRFNEAIALYDVAKTKDPYDYRVWSNSSHASFKLEDYMNAELDAIVAMKLNPFFEKAYYRAGQAALKDDRPQDGEQYAEFGILVCGESKELRQILDEATREDEDDYDFIDPYIKGTIEELPWRNITEGIVKSAVETMEHTCHQKHRGSFKDTQDLLRRKRHELGDALIGALGTQKRENKKSNKKSKKPAEDVATTLAAAAAGGGGGSKEHKVKEEEEKKSVQDKREDKNKKPKFSFEEALQEGQRLFLSEQFPQAIEVYSKCLTYNDLTDCEDHVKAYESYNIQVIQFIIGVSKVHSSRGYIMEGLEAMQTLLGPTSVFPHKQVCHFWLAVSFEKICCYKLAQKHGQLCRDAIKKSKNNQIRPIKWPGSDQVISWTLPNVLEFECKLLLETSPLNRPSPKAKCRYKTCITTQGIPYAKDQIYLTDPDFKGYLNVICEENCIVSYHPCCWKAFKEQHDGGVNRMSDKDFLGKVCVTPDCSGKISSIQIYDDAGELKNEMLKDKKDRKHMAAPVKQKKKKDKKKEKTQTHKKRTRVESVSESQPTNEDPSPPTAAESSTAHTTTTTTNTSNSNTTNHDKHKPATKPVLPIDPESLEKAQVTILKPGIDTEEASPTKATKKNKKKKAKKPVNQPNLLGDPLEAELGVQSEYIARLRVLRQQKDALEAGDHPNPMKPITVASDTQKPVMLLDPDNPFYLPQHLRDNPEELENVLQKKLTTISPPGLDQEAINTLLVFMYDWLKSVGPMHTSDPRLAEQVAENFPQEAREYLSQCGGITGLLMQSIKFAMFDSIICVYDDAVKAQEMMCQEVNDKMMRSKYLVRYSDGQKAKRFTHLLDDTKSTCSTTSSSSQPVTNNRCPGNYTNYDDPNNNDNDNESTASFAPISKYIVENFNKFADGTLNPTAPVFEPLNCNDDEEEEEEDDETASSKYNSEYIETWAVQAGEKVSLSPTDEDGKLDVDEGEEEELEEEIDIVDEDEVEQEEEEEERESVQQEAEETLVTSPVEDDMEATELYISQLHEDKDNLTRDLENEQQQNQVLSDKLYQVKSQYKSEVMKLKQQLEELKDQNKELTTEKNAISLQKEADAKKFKGDLSRMNEEMKATGSRLQSVELKGERCLDRNNELMAKLAEETELTTQLKEELDKMKNLQESLTSCSRRAREAEVKYLCTKKDLVDASLTRAITRLTEEATVMRQLLPWVKDDILPRTIVAWDEAIKNLLDQQRVFKEESTRLLGMIHQGRPLSALPVGDLGVPAIPYLTIAPLLSIFQNNHHKPHHPVPDVLAKDMPRHPSPVPQGPPPSMSQPPPKVPVSMMPPGMLNGHHMFMHNGGLPHNHPSAYASGAIPKSASGPPPGIPPSKTPELPGLTPQTDSPNQLFVGQLPWDFTEHDVKTLFSRFGEVASANIFDKGLNADGRAVPKYGFITFRNADDCFKALSSRPIYVRNHMLNVQAKEPKKPTKPGEGVVGGEGGVGVVGGGGGGGLAGLTMEPDATKGTHSSAYGLTNITVNANAEAKKSAAVHHHTLPTSSPTLHLHQPPPPTTQSVTKPKFQKLLPSNSSGGGIVAPPPKLVRPQGKTVPNSSKQGSQASAAKEENVMPTSTSYTRLIEICKQRFGKEFTSPDICSALREVRAQNNNSLSGLTTDKIMDRVKHQLRSRRPGAGATTVAPWASLTQGKGVKAAPEWQGPNKEEVVKEEQCSICLEPLHTSPNQSLACLHTFHALCINDWIKIQSNCPNCRKFALMPDEYPTLSHN